MVGHDAVVGFLEQVYVIRFDNNGDTLWTGHYGSDSLHELGTGIKETTDKGFILSFYRSPGPTGIIKIDSSGNLQFLKNYYLYDGAQFYNVNVLQDGGFIACGVVQDNTDTISTTHGVIMRTDSLGNPIWTKEFVGTDGAEFYEAQQTYDGNIIIGGISYGSRWSPYFLKLNLNGDTIWTQQYLGNEGTYILSITQCTDGGFIAAGIIYHASNNSNVYLIKLDSIGQTEWVKEFGDPVGSDLGYCVRQTNDGGFVICGMYSVGYNFYLIKTDSIGNISTGIIDPHGESNLVSLYPNPTSNVLHISCNTLMLQLQITDITGRQVYTACNLQQHTSIDVSQLPNGLYFCTIKTQNALFTKKLNIIR